MELIFRYMQYNNENPRNIIIDEIDSGGGIMYV